ncbi:MAG: hypothetical protein IKS04_03450 [Clostridia bacterium]|nr:hypothetical protein [Clostridia bacterium]
MKKAAVLFAAFITAALFSVNAAADAALPPLVSAGLNGADAVLLVVIIAVAAALIAVTVCVIKKKKSRKNPGESEASGKDGGDAS